MLGMRSKYRNRAALYYPSKGAGMRDFREFIVRKHFFGNAMKELEMQTCAAFDRITVNKEELDQLFNHLRDLHYKYALKIGMPPQGFGIGPRDYLMVRQFIIEPDQIHIPIGECSKSGMKLRIHGTLFPIALRQDSGVECYGNPQDIDKLFYLEARLSNQAKGQE
jgi:hypothetical protein